MTPVVEKTMKGLARINHYALFIEKTVLIVLIVGMMIFGFLQVFSRFILQAPIGWSEELLTYSFSWASFIGASMAIYTKSHFSVDLVMKLLSEQTIRIIRILTWTLILVFSLFIVIMGIRLTIANSIQMMNILPISMLWAYLAMPVCGVFIFLHSVEKLAETILGVEGEELEVE